jgi:3-methyladenine DNA glycosylase/8-oxoguanine DNA glycosylase
LIPSAADLRALARRDAVLGAFLRRHGPFPGFPLPATRRMPAYVFLARSICFQQLAYSAANTIWRRCCALTPGPSFPAPEALLRLSDQQLRAAGLSRNKIAAVRDLAAHVMRGELRPRALARRADAEVTTNLTRVHGIGPWTAQMYLIFKLGRLDVLPTTDLGVQEGARRIYGLSQRPDPQRLERLATAWTPLRSVGAWICWQVVDEGNE